MFRLLTFDQRIPAPALRKAPARGGIDGDRADAQEGREGPPRMAGDLRAQIGNALPGRRDGGFAAALSQAAWIKSEAGADPLDDRRDRRCPAAVHWRRRKRVPEGLDELGTSQDALVGSIPFAPAAEVGDRGPPAEAADEPPALEVGPVPLADPCRDEGPVGRAGARAGRPELGENGVRGLPWTRDGAQERTVPGPGEAVKYAELGDDLGADRVQMKVADQFQQVGLLLDDNRLVPILKEMAHAVMPPIEGAGVARQQGPHHPRQRAPPRADQEMGMVRHQRPGLHGEPRGRHERGQAGHEVGAIDVVAENDPPFDPANHHMVEDARGVQPGLTGHGERRVD